MLEKGWPQRDKIVQKFLSDLEDSKQEAAVAFDTCTALPQAGIKCN